MTEASLLSQYQDLKPHLHSWGQNVINEIASVLKPLSDENRLKIHPSYRVKDDSSFISKAFYRKKPYTDPISNIEDKIGTRVVMLTSADVSEASALLMNHSGWIARKDRDPINEAQNNPYIFDYQSIHLIVKPPLQGSEYGQDLVNLLTCEIQIRTLLQHAYAEVSHDSTYKGPYKNDPEIQRKMAKSMALMEATDDYFCDIFKLMTDEKRKYRLYLDELSKRFLAIKPDFKKEQTDITLSDNIFELLTRRDISIADLDRFLGKRQSEIAPYIQKNQSLLFKQPVILLIAYFLYNHPSVLQNDWPLNHDALSNVKNGFGYSAET